MDGEISCLVLLKLDAWRIAGCKSATSVIGGMLICAIPQKLGTVDTACCNRPTEITVSILCHFAPHCQSLHFNILPLTDGSNGATHVPPFICFHFMTQTGDVHGF